MVFCVFFLSSSSFSLTSFLISSASTCDSKLNDAAQSFFGSIVGHCKLSICFTCSSDPYLTRPTMTLVGSDVATVSTFMRLRMTESSALEYCLVPWIEILILPCSFSSFPCVRTLSGTRICIF